MDWLFNIYHTLVDFFLIFVYFFQKLGTFLGKLFSLLISPFLFLKDFITNIDLTISPAELSFTFPFSNSIISTIFLDAFIFILIMLLVIKRILRE